MSREDILSPGAANTLEKLARLFRDAPILVEVGFFKCGTSSDWYLCQTEDEFDELVRRLPPGRDLYVKSVRDFATVTMRYGFGRDIRECNPTRSDGMRRDESRPT